MHAVEEITSGYRVALIYNLTVQRGGLSADNTAITPELLSALQKLKDQDRQVVYSLGNKYSLSQRKLGFKGRDRYIISNIAAAIAKIGGGISLACGDLEVKRTDPDEDDIEYSDEDQNLDHDTMNFMANLNGREVEISLNNMEHLAGPYRHFSDSKLVWTGKYLFSLGLSLDAMRPYDQEEEETGNEGVMTFNWYRTSCITLWPTSESRGIQERGREENLSWKDILGIVNQQPPPTESEFEKAQINFHKVEFLIDRCIVHGLPDHQVREAGDLVYSLLDLLPDDLRSRVETNLISSSVDVQIEKEEAKSEYSLKSTAIGFSRLLRMKTLFRKDIQISFTKTVADLLGRSSILFTPETLQLLLETYQNSEYISDWIRCVFESHPNVNLLQDFFHKMEKEDMNHLQNTLTGISVYDLHESIISGIKRRFSTFYVDDEDLYGVYITNIGNPEEYELYQGFGLRRPGGSTIPGIHQTMSPPTFCMKNYVEFLDKQPLPHKTRLLSLLVDSIMIPVDKITPTDEKMTLRSREQLIVTKNLIEQFTKTPSLVGFSEIEKLRENVIEATIKYFAQAKPETPNFYLPAWNSPKCELGSGCAICGVLNQFLRSKIESSVEFPTNWNIDEKEHYKILHAELTYVHYPQVLLKYEYRSELEVSFSEWSRRFNVSKIAKYSYADAKIEYNGQVKERETVFKMIGEPFNREGRIRREVPDGQFVEKCTATDDDEGDDEMDDEEDDEGEEEWEGEGEGEDLILFE
ncbi:hypothetical protein TWF694_002951 [Orbilia ellipsospora]